MQAQRAATASTSAQQVEEEENCGPMPIQKLEVHYQ